jgi:integrase/recombinase XerD
VLTGLAAQTLRVYLKHTRPKLARADVATEALFLTQRGTRMTYGAMREALDGIVALAKETKIEVPSSFGWHDQRRSFTTGTAEKHPEKLILISRLLGHTGLATIHRYIRPSKRTLSDAARRVAAELSPTT